MAVVVEELTQRAAAALALKEEGNALLKQGEYIKACRKYREGIKQFEYKKGHCALEVIISLLFLLSGSKQGQELESVRPLLTALHLNLAAVQLKQCMWEVSELLVAQVLIELCTACGAELPEGIFCATIIC